MATCDRSPPKPSFTTNEHDQREAARLRNQLQAEKRSKQTISESNTAGTPLPSVEICEGAHKYVQITGSLVGMEQVFVVSRNNAAYHRNAAEPFIAKLKRAGYYDIEVTGGGRVAMDEARKKISIFGFSYGFGKANHQLSADIVRKDERYQYYDVDWSDDGY
jgi:phosphohistidine phosphatase